MKIILLLLLFYGLSCPAQTNMQAFATKAKQLQDYGEDFLGFGKGEDNSLEHEISTDLFTVAFQDKERVDTTRAFLTIYDGTLCPQDRRLVAMVTQEEFSQYSRSIALDIKQVNLDIRDTKKPGVAAEALRMQSDLRELQSLLDSIKLSGN